MRTIKIIPLLLILIGCGSKSSVSRISTTNSNTENSFYYALPKSSIIVTVDVERKVEEPGVYSKVASYFGYSKVSTAKSTKFEIKQTDITTKTYLDENQIFKYNLSKNFLNKNEFKIEYGINGEVVNSEFKNENQIIPFASTVVGFVSNVFGNLPMMAAYMNTAPAKEDPVLGTKLYKEAKADFDALNNLKQKYYDALKNENGSTKEIVDLKLKKLEDALNELSSKFTGVIKKTTYQMSFEIDPLTLVTQNNGLYSVNSSTNNVHLFNFDPDNGIERIFKNSWDVHIDNIENAGVAKNIKYFLSLNSLDTKNISKIINDINTKNVDGAFYYRLPASAKFLIVKNESGNDKNIKSIDIQIPQYGITLAAPSNMKSLNFKLHPVLGTIQSVSGTTKSLDLEQIDNLGTEVSGLIDKFKKEESPNKKDELIKELERDVKIKNLQEQLNSNSNE